MLTEIRAGNFTIRGVSVGGIYTSLHVKELDVLLDVGLAPRSFAGAKALFLSHGHADHCGALMTLIGARMLMCNNRRLKIFLPAPIADTLRASLDLVSTLQRYDVNVKLCGMEPGDEAPLHANLRVRAFRTYHPVPSLGYLFFRRVPKLRPEYVGLDGAEIRDRRRAGEDLFVDREILELAYATDTLVKVLDAEPALLSARTLILECTFLDDAKPPERAHESCHIHLDDLLPYADRFRNDAVVLMHFSQNYRPADVRAILDARCPPGLRERVVPLVPNRRRWPG
ncbi:MAG: MBL fold metallo-hydrolase [Deltaproteobacteria bacterium]|nr:MAG: MBL fold metallo-hydrolase [Deltaproteobacteria bacterium]